METMALHKKWKIYIKLSSPHKIFTIDNLIIIMAANRYILWNKAMPTFSIVS